MSFGARELLPLLALAPLAAGLAAWFWRRHLAALAAWASRGLWPKLDLATTRSRVVASLTLSALAVAGVAAALAQPRWGESREQVERRGVDVVFVLDTSLSMAATDVQPSRLWTATATVRRLVGALPGHRVALVQAEGDGLVMAPLTVDAAVIDLLLDSVEPGSLPVPGTRLQPALETALRLFPPESRKHRVMIVVSDGEDHGGSVTDAARRAAEEGVVVHALGVGTPEGSPLPLPDGSGRFKRDARGDVVVSHLDESVLEELARTTGGVYRRITGPGDDLGAVVGRVEAMERRRLEADVVATLEERFQWPLGLAIAAGMLHLALPALRRTAEAP